MTEDSRDQFHVAMWAGERKRAACDAATGGLHEYANPLNLDFEICVHCDHQRDIEKENITAQSERECAGTT